MIELGGKIATLTTRLGEQMKDSVREIQVPRVLVSALMQTASSKDDVFSPPGVVLTHKADGTFEFMVTNGYYIIVAPVTDLNDIEAYKAFFGQPDIMSRYALIEHDAWKVACLKSPKKFPLATVAVTLLGEDEVPHYLELIGDWAAQFEGKERVHELALNPKLQAIICKALAAAHPRAANPHVMVCMPADQYHPAKITTRVTDPGLVDITAYLMPMVV